MSYCVNCGVELERSEPSCPLCHTPVQNPKQPLDAALPPPFPSRREAVQPVSKIELALLISVMLLSTALLCGGLNLFFFFQERWWSLYIIGATILLWIWLVPPLLYQGMALWVRLMLDMLAVAIYVFLIALELNGLEWFWGLALPTILTGGALLMFLGLVLRKGRSILTGSSIAIGSVGVFFLMLEYFADCWDDQLYRPGWSVLVAVICTALIIPLVVVRLRPALRDEARKRFHV